MHWRTSLGTVLAIGVLLTGAQVTLASTGAAKTPNGSKAPAARSVEPSEVHQVRGDVIAVELQASPMTLTLNTMEGKRQLTVGVDITGKTMIREGKLVKSLGDIKAGDHVWLRYRRSNDSLVADTIRSLPPTHTAAAMGKKAK